MVIVAAGRVRAQVVQVRLVASYVVCGSSFVVAAIAVVLDAFTVISGLDATVGEGGIGLYVS